jgi:hypothetical protein
VAKRRSAYKERTARGLCGLCGARKKRPRRGTCSRCAKASYASNRAWIAVNKDKTSQYNRRRNAKRSANRARCLSCPAPVKKFRRCLDCRTAQVKRKRLKGRTYRPRQRIDGFAVLSFREAGMVWTEIAHHLGCTVVGAFLAAKRVAKSTP